MTTSSSDESKQSETASSATDKRRDPLLGSILASKYEILSLLGRGATTSVYKAHDNELQRFVAIKILRTDSVFNEQLIRRFKQECETLALLRHTNIVQLYDSGVNESDQPFLVMEFVDGISLKQLIETDNNIEVTKALKIFVQICAALSAAHEKGIVHRDMKPANVMLAKGANGDDFVKVLDFGVAKLVVQSETFQTKTQTGEMLGTLLYMSPEQCLEQIIDARCDVYSVGCVLFETLTGKPPLIGRTAFETMNKHLTEMPEKLSKVRPDRRFDPQLDAILQIAMAKDPNNRYQSISQLQNALLAMLDKGESCNQEIQVGSTAELSPVSSIPKSFTLQNDLSTDSSEVIGKIACYVLLGMSCVGAMVYPIFWVLAFFLVVCVLAPYMSQSNQPSRPKSQSTEDDTSRAGTIYFLAMEALDGVALQTIYADKLLQYNIQESEILAQKTHLVAAQRQAWMDVKNFSLGAFDNLDEDKDGFISKSELIRARSQSHPKLREHALLSFLINNIGDIHAIVKSEEDADKGVRKNDLSKYFDFLENAAPKKTLSLPLSD
jgi:serine/threonine protein kinase